MKKSLVTSALTILLSILVSWPMMAQRPGGGSKGYKGYGAKGTFEVKGEIKDVVGKGPIEYATVALYRMRDSSLVTGVVTNDKGKFHIRELSFGKYYLISEFVGFERYTSSVFALNNDNPVQNLGEIGLKPSADAIDEVEVVVEKPLIMTSIDKKVFNAEKNITAAGGTAVDVLNNVPSVVVDQDGNISLRGNSNVTVLIDGKPSGLTGGGRQALLENIPASNIQDIEIITNPSAKYDPDGLSGIINIKLKKNKLEGANGSVTLTLGSDDHPENGQDIINKYNLNTQLNYRNSKFNVYGNYSYNNRETGMVNGVVQDVFIGENVSSLVQSDLGVRNRVSHLIKGGTDLYLNRYNTVSLSATANLGDNGGATELLYDNLFNNIRQSASVRSALENSTRNSLDLNASHKKTFKKQGRELSTELNMSNGGSEAISDFDQYFGDEITGDPYVMQNTTTNRVNKVNTLQMDFVNPHGKTAKTEMGWKVITRNIDNDFFSESFDSTEASFYPDTLLNNQFNYAEQIYALYAMEAFELNKKWSAQGGLRAEQAFLSSELVTTGETYDSSYFAVYPSAYLQYKIKDSARESSSLVWSYSRRINRPRTRTLNPFADYSNPNSIRRGNPYLRPEFTDSYEMTYSWFKKGIAINSSVYYKHTRNQISRVSFLDGQIRHMMWQNVGRGSSYGLETSVSGKLLPYLRIVVSGNGNWNETRGEAVNEELQDTVNLDNSAFGFRGNLMLNFKIKKKYDLQLSSWYRAPTNTAQGRIYAMGSADIALKRTFKKKFDVSIRVSDIFNTQYFSMLLDDFDTQGNSYRSDRKHDWESQNVYLSLGYRFGKQSRSRGRWGGKKGKGNEGGFNGGGSDQGM